MTLNIIKASDINFGDDLDTRIDHLLLSGNSRGSQSEDDREKHNQHCRRANERHDPTPCVVRTWAASYVV